MTAADRPAGTNEGVADDVLIEAMVGTLRAERRRGPADFLVVLDVLLTIAAAGLLVLALLVGPGMPQDLLLNLTTELVGALIALVLIGGLWQQMQSSAIEDMDELARAFRIRGDRGLTDAERTACRRIIEVHRRTESSPPVVRQLRALLFAIHHRGELRAIEEVLRDAGRSTTRAEDGEADRTAARDMLAKGDGGS